MSGDSFLSASLSPEDEGDGFDQDLDLDLDAIETPSDSESLHVPVYGLDLGVRGQRLQPSLRVHCNL